MIAWPLAKAFLATYWKPVLLGGALAAVVVWHLKQVNDAWHAGRDALIAEQAQEAERRRNNAQAADAAARKCADDPACRLQNDGNRRD